MYYGKRRAAADWTELAAPEPYCYYRVVCVCGDTVVKASERNAQLAMRGHARHCKEASFTVTPLKRTEQETAKR